MPEAAQDCIVSSVWNEREIHGDEIALGIKRRTRIEQRCGANESDRKNDRSHPQTRNRRTLMPQEGKKGNYAR